MDVLTRRPTVEEAVRRKWRRAAEKEWWYQKFAHARRRRLIKLSERQNHRCCYCTRLTWLFQTAPTALQSGYQPDRLPGMSKGAKATLEHLIGISDGGTEHESNLVMACYRCNSVRSNWMSALEFWEIVQDPRRYSEFVTRGRRFAIARKRNERERSEKRQIKRRRTVLWWAYLCTVSPEFGEVFAAWERWLDHEAHGLIDFKQVRLAFYTDGMIAGE
jgi:5-methylcytosine-specific restriction endonuclease McrA